MQLMQIAKKSLATGFPGMTKYPVSQKHALAIVGGLFSFIAGSMAKNEPVTVGGFGTFEVRKAGAKVQRNPRTGTPINVPERAVPRIAFSKKVKDAVRTGVAPASIVTADAEDVAAAEAADKK